MGNTYTVHSDTPVCISHLTKQKQMMMIETKVIVLCVDNTLQYDNYKMMVQKIASKGFVIITVRQNISSEKLVNNQSKTFLQTVFKEICDVSNNLAIKSIHLDIQSIAFIAHSSFCDQLIRIFDITDRLKSKVYVYDKIRTDERSATMKQNMRNNIDNINNETITMINNHNASLNCKHYDEFCSKISSLILLNPTTDAKRARLNLIYRVAKPMQIIFTDSTKFNIDDKIVSMIEKICTGPLRVDRIKNIDASDIIMISKRNIAEKTRKNKIIGTMIDRIIEFIHAIDSQYSIQ